MVLLVVAGKSDCPFYAKAELLADTLSMNLPNFKVFKICKHPSQWNSWLKETCNEMGFQHDVSPIVWRELVERGGAGRLIGDSNDFLEYVKSYYQITSDMTSEQCSAIADENMETLSKDIEEAKKIKSWPLRVCITNATSSLVYNILPSLTNGDVFGKNQELDLRFVDGKENFDKLQGVVMELEDLASPVIKKITATGDLEVGVRGAQVVIFTDGIPMPEGATDEKRKDIIKANKAIYEAYGPVLEAEIDKDGVVFVGGPLANYNASILSKYAPKISKRKFIALSSKLQENRAKSVISKRLKVNSSFIKDVVIWGNPEVTQVIDISKSCVYDCESAIMGPPTYSRSVAELIHDNKWINGPFQINVKDRQEDIIKVCENAVYLSVATAMTEQIAEFWQGIGDETFTSMSIVSEGWYGIPYGVVFSFPVKLKGGREWQIITDWPLEETLRTRLVAIGRDLFKLLNASTDMQSKKSKKLHFML